MKHQASMDYIEEKVQILRDCGVYNANKRMFVGLTEIQIDNKARDMLIPPRKKGGLAYGFLD